MCANFAQMKSARDLIWSAVKGAGWGLWGFTFFFLEKYEMSLSELTLFKQCCENAHISALLWRINLKKWRLLLNQVISSHDCNCNHQRCFILELKIASPCFKEHQRTHCRWGVFRTWLWANAVFGTPLKESALGPSWKHGSALWLHIHTV